MANMALHMSTSASAGAATTVTTATPAGTAAATAAAPASSTGPRRSRSSGDEATTLLTPASPPYRSPTHHRRARSNGDAAQPTPAYSEAAAEVAYAVPASDDVADTMDADVDMGDGACESDSAAPEDVIIMGADTMSEPTHHMPELYHHVDNVLDDDDDDDVMGEVEVVESPAPELSTEVEVTVVASAYTAVTPAAMATNAPARHSHGQHNPPHSPSSTTSAVTPVTTQHLQPPAAAVGAAAGAGAVADGAMSTTSTGTNVCNNALQGMARLQAELFAHLPPAVGPYKIDPKGQLGHGSFSCVFRGRHAETGEEVAIKAISLHDLNVQGYRAELRITRLAQGHPGIVHFLGEFIQPVRCGRGLFLVLLPPQKAGFWAYAVI